MNKVAFNFTQQATMRFKDNNAYAIEVNAFSDDAFIFKAFNKP